MAPQFPIQTEGVHPTGFVLSEANGHRSRDNAYLADPAVVAVGGMLKKSAAATTDELATYVNATQGSECEAIALYGGATSSGQPLRISVIARDAEVNLRALNWGSMSAAEQVIGIAKLLTFGIVCRI